MWRMLEFRVGSIYLRRWNQPGQHRYLRAKPDHSQRTPGHSEIALVDCGARHELELTAVEADGCIQL
jgi:hypothetical protein